MKRLVVIISVVMIGLVGPVRSYGCSLVPVPSQDFAPSHCEPVSGRYCVQVGSALAMNAGGLGQGIWPYKQRSYDPDGTCTDYLPEWSHGIRRWEWTFGDGLGGDPNIEQCLYSNQISTDGWVDGMTQHTYQSPAERNLELKVYDNDEQEGVAQEDSSAAITYKILAFSLGMDINGWANEFVPFNDDDDDGDKIIDYEDAYNKDGTKPNNDDENDHEDELVEVNLGFAPTGITYGKVQLFLLDGQLSGLKIWDNPKKGEPNLLIPQGPPDRYGNLKWYRRWDPCELPAKVWVEAVGMPSGNPTGLGLRYIINETDPEPTYCGDAKWAYAWVAQLDMDMDGVKDDPYTYPGLTEEISPGGYVAFNTDDDDNDGVVDYDDNDNAAEDDLVRIELNRPHPAYFLPIDDENPVTLKALSGGSKIKIWQSQTKGGSPLTLPHQYESDTGWPKVLWVEGVQTSSDPCDVTLALEYTTQDWTIRDKINITVFDAALYECASDFMPKGGDEDNSVDITAAIEPSGLTGIIKFTLYGVSDVPGYCLNRPAQIPDPGQEDSDSWKDLQFEDMQTGLTVCGPYNEEATTDEPVNSQDVTVKSYDYGAYGKIKAEVEIGGTWYTAHVVCGTAKFARIPLDDDKNNIADAWAYNAGNAGDDDDTSLNNSHNGDGLTRYEEYRGVDINGDNIISGSERLNPSEKNLFIQGSGFGGDFPGFSWGNAFNEAQIVVHEFEGEVGTEDRNIDVLVVEAYNGTAPGNSGNIGRSGPPVGGVRQWWWSTMGQSDVGTSTQYGSEISYTRVYKIPINNSFDQKPHKDGTTLTAPGVWGGAPDGLFDPVANVEDADDDGVLDPFENDGNANAPNDDADGVLDGDYPVQSGGVWNFSQNFSPHDIDDDGSIELPLGSTTNDYTRAHVVMRTANHEMGHSVGISPHCSDTTCAMYGGINNYNRHGHFCNTCRAKILIHNN